MTGIELQITAEDTSPENLRKFLESDDPALVTMGLSMAKGTKLPKELHALVLSLRLWHKNPAVRNAATATLKKQAPDIINKTKHLKSTFQIKDPEKLRNISVELKNLGFGEAYPFESLVEQLQSSGGWNQNQKFLEILGEVGDYRAIKPLIRKLCDVDGTGHLTASIGQAFNELDDIRAVEELIAALDSVKEKRHIILHAMNEIKGDFSKNLVEPLINLINEDFIHLLDDENGLEVLEARHKATKILGKIGSTKSSDTLIRIIENEPDRFLTGVGDSYYNNDARRGAIISLGEMREKRALDSIIALLSQFWLTLPSGYYEHTYFNKSVSKADEALYQRFRELNSAIISLGKIGDKNCAKLLLDFLEKLVEYDFGKYRIIGLSNESHNKKEEYQEIGLICSITYSLSKIGIGVDSLVNLLEHGNEKVRSNAARALGKIGDNRAIQPLLQALDKPENAEKFYNSYKPKKEITYSKDMQYFPYNDSFKIPDEIEIQHSILKDSYTVEGRHYSRDVYNNFEPICVKSTIIEALRNLEAEIPIRNLRLSDLFDLLKENNKQAVPHLSEMLGTHMYESQGGGLISIEIAKELKEFGWSPPSEDLEIKYLIALSEWSDLVKFGNEASKQIINFLDSYGYDNPSVWLNAVDASKYSETTYKVDGYAYDSSDKVYSALSSEGTLIGVWDPHVKRSDREDNFIKKLFPFGAIAKIGDKKGLEFLNKKFHDKDLCTCKYYHHSCIRMAAGIALGFTDGMPAEEFWKLCSNVEKLIEESTPKWEFASSSQPGVIYVVRLDSDKNPICECKGFEYRRTCKHVEKVKGDTMDLMSKLSELDS